MSGALPAVPLDPLQGDDPREIGGFRLLGRLGAGGMGIAYLAEGPQGWLVVKTMWPNLRGDSSLRARLGRELDAMRVVESDFVAKVIAQDLQAESPWFAMEFVPGVTLKRRVDEGGALTGSEVRIFASQLAQALSLLAAAGVVHRDLKPANIMMSPTGVRLIDFGVADLSEATQLTQTGFVVGSAGWLAPEQITGATVTSACDVHAWGLCVLYAATGHAPFAGENTTATIYQVLHNQPEIPAALGEPLASQVAGALAKEPGARPTAQQLAAGGADALQGGSPTRIAAVPATSVNLAKAPIAIAPMSQSRSSRKGLLIGSLATLVVLALVIAGFAIGRSGTSSAPAASRPVITVTASIAPTPAASVAAAPAPAPISATPAKSAPVATVTKTVAPVASAPEVLSGNAISSVSSTCANSLGVTGAELLVDGDTHSGWRCDNRVSNAQGNVNSIPSVGQTIDFYFARAYTLSGVQVVEGAGRDDFTWCENGRLAEVSWDFHDGSAPVNESFPDRMSYPAGNLYYPNSLPGEHTTDHVSMTVDGIFPAGSSCSQNGESGRPWEYGQTAKPSEVRFVGSVA